MIQVLQLIKKIVYPKQCRYYNFNKRIGGFIMTSMKNRIKIDNTLDKRLEILKQSAIPEIRRQLFEHEHDHDLHSHK